MSRYIDADVLGSLVDSHGNVHYEHIKSIPSITLEELKSIAKEMGYEVVSRKHQIPKLKPCKCGHNRRETWLYSGGIKLVCKNCGWYSVGKNRKEAVINWNKAIDDDSTV